MTFENQQAVRRRTLDDSKGNAVAEPPKTQFSVRSIAALTAAIAVWFWIFRKTKPLEIAVFSGAAVSAGIVGQFVYSFWLPRRVTVLATTLLVYNFGLLAFMLLGPSSGVSIAEAMSLLIGFLIQPAGYILRSGATPETFALVVATAIFAPAHSLRPSFPSALITAFGVGIWYSAGWLMLSYGA